MATELPPDDLVVLRYLANVRAHFDQLGRPLPLEVPGSARSLMDKAELETEAPLDDVLASLVDSGLVDGVPLRTFVGDASELRLVTAEGLEILEEHPETD